MTNTDQPAVPNASTNGFVMNPGLYNKLKFTALTVLPALTTLYFAIGSVWNLHHLTEVIGTMTAVDTFLGVLIGLSAATYNKSGAGLVGHISIVQDADSKRYILELNGEPSDIDSMKTATFSVGNPMPPPQA